MAIEGRAAGAARRVAGEDGREEEDEGGGGEGRASPHADRQAGSGRPRFRASDPTGQQPPARLFLDSHGLVDGPTVRYSAARTHR